MECFLSKEEIYKYEKKVVDECKKLKNKDSLKKDKDHDEKINPIVVALLVDKDRKCIISHRGEMFDGDHAEYNLFTNKLDGTDQSEKILFVSLEPCTHDSRLSTISCSEIIGKTRIEKMFMGTFDPDNLVRYEGYLYLKNKGVEIEMFDEKLARELIEINEDFFESKIGDDEFFRRFKKDHEMDLDKKAIAYYLGRIDKKINDDEGENLDYHLEEIIEKEEDNLIKKFYQKAKESHYIYDTIENSKRKVACEFGFMQAFYKNPSIFYKGSKIKINDYRNSEIEVASKIFNEPLFISANQAYYYVCNNLKPFMEENDLLKNVFRETLLNAVIHKNYKSYAPISICLYNDKIEIQNPYVKDKLDVNSLCLFKMPSNPVNGCFGDIAYDMGLFEGQGLGTTSFKKYLEHLAKDNKLDNKFKPYRNVCDILVTTIPLV